MEDEIFIRFAADSYKNLYDKLGDDSFESSMMSNAITSAQKRVEGQNFDTRKQLLNYDDVLSRQRKIMYERRDHILYSKSVSDTIPGYLDLVAKTISDQSIVIRDQERVIDGQKFQDNAVKLLSIDPNQIPVKAFDQCPYQDAVELFSARLEKIYRDHGKDWTEDMRNFAEKTVTLDCIDRRWTKHIDQMSKLRDAIWLRSYAQTDPLQAYTNEGFDMFNRMNENIAVDVVRTLLHVAIRANPNRAQQPQRNAVPNPGAVNRQATVKSASVEFKPTPGNPEMEANITPDDDGIDRSNPTAKIN